MEPPFGPGQAIVNLPWLGSIVALVIGALLLLLYVYRRRTYILEWVGGWLLLAGALLALSREPAGARVAHLAAGVTQFLIVTSGLLFALSVDSFRQRPLLSRAYGVVLLALLIWFALAPLALGSWSAHVPGPLVSAGALGAAGAGYLTLVARTQLLGAGLIGLTFVGIAGLNVWLSMSFAGLSTVSSFELASVMALLYIFAGFGMHLLVFEDMTYELRRTNRRLESAQADLRQLAITDALTGCYNRRFFDEVIGREIQRHRRYHIPMSVLFLDVDRFKAVNDSNGHETGDRLLKQVAEFLGRHVREADYVFRWGGDEFVVLLTCTEDEAISKGRMLQARFASLPLLAELPPGVGLSIGCAEFPEDIEDALRIVRQADERMYRDKGRDR